VSVHQELPPGCEPRCHACQHRSLDLAASLAQKQAYLARALAPWADRLAQVRSAPESARLGYRHRVTLSARYIDAVGWQFGLMRRDELIAIHDCPVHDARVRALVHHLARRLPPASELPLAFLQVAGRQATLIVKAHDVAAGVLDGATNDLAATGIEGLWLHLHPSAGRRLFARSGWSLAWGRPESRDELGGLHGPTAFLQPQPALHREVLRRAGAYLGAVAGASVLDLYCGHGTSLRVWTDAGARALGVELSGEAVRDAARNAPRAAILRGSCLQRLPQIREWWQSADDRPLAYLNPPRSGLEPGITCALARELRPSRIAYLSCSAGTLARDLGMFESGGYRIEAIQPYDFFPQTHHVEALALLGVEA
jgi:23S rRNA (uracil1939-C5)-methyltransferase